MIKVAKFGGSSVADAEQFKKIKKIVKADNSRKFIVVSAVGKANKNDIKVTDLLYVLYSHVKYGVDYEPILKTIENKYYSIRNELKLNTDLESEFKTIRSKLNKQSDVDYIVSRGEYLTAILMADYLKGDFLDAQDCIFFDYRNNFQYSHIEESLKRYIKSKNVVIIPGFYGSLPNGKIKVMSRGGSDITGAVIANVVNADVYENWTDVSGILIADPRIVDNPKSVNEITYNELREMSYMGASVLHDEAIFPVKEKSIPLNIKNTNKPLDPGTMILKECKDTGNKNQSISGITGKRNFSVISLSKSHISSEIGILRSVLEIVAKYNLSVESVPNGIDSLSLVIESEKLKECKYDLIADIKEQIKPDTIVSEDELALVAVVGRKLKNYKGFSGKLFGLLGKNDINIKLISQNADEISIIFGVANIDFNKTINTIYKEFVK